MALFFATVAIVAGTSMWLLAFRERHMANPDKKISHFGAPPKSDGRASAYLMLGGAILGFTASYLGTQLNLWAGFVVMLMAGASYSALIYWHNWTIDQQVQVSR